MDCTTYLLRDERSEEAVEEFHHAEGEIAVHSNHNHLTVIPDKFNWFLKQKIYRNKFIETKISEAD